MIHIKLFCTIKEPVSQPAGIKIKFRMFKNTFCYIGDRIVHIEFVGITQGLVGKQDLLTGKHLKIIPFNGNHSFHRESNC